VLPRAPLRTLALDQWVVSRMLPCLGQGRPQVAPTVAAAAMAPRLLPSPQRHSITARVGVVVAAWHACRPTYRIAALSSSRSMRGSDTRYRMAVMMLVV
jgi:hypothetical protein